MTVNVSRKVLLDEVRANREAHRAVYDEAIVGYKAQAIKHLKSMIYDLENGKLVSTSVILPVPQDHSREYDLIIGMLETSLDESVQISGVDYRKLVMDRWYWKQSWVNTISLYVEEV